MLGLTSIDLSLHENHRSNWVVVIGLELLSLACPGLDLGSCYVTSYYLSHPRYCYDYVDPISVENTIWGDGNGICWCDAVTPTFYKNKNFVQIGVHVKMHIKL
jgi:hypothetical protein